MKIIAARFLKGAIPSKELQMYISYFVFACQFIRTDHLATYSLLKEYVSVKFHTKSLLAAMFVSITLLMTDDRESGKSLFANVNAEVK